MRQFVKCASAAAAAVAMMMATSSPAQAQSSGEFSGGYQYAHVPNESLPGGWYADYAVPVNGMWAVFGEVNGSYKNGAKQHTYGGGLRFLGRMMPSVRAYGQVLFGGATFSVSSFSESAFAMQFGGGVNIPVDAKWGVRIGADYRPVFFSDDTENQFRFVVGVVVPGR